VAVLGSAFTLLMQLLLAFVEFDRTGFIVVWYGGKLFGMLSSFSSSFMIQELAPKELLGYWNGRHEALGNLLLVFVPLIFAVIYDQFGNPRGKEMLLCSSAVSLVATLAYTPLIQMMPKKQEPKKPELESLEFYESLSDLDWGKLPFEILEKVSSQMMENGKVPRLMHWGEYAKERPFLGEIHRRAAEDFAWMRKEMLVILTDRDRIIEEQQEFKKYRDMVPEPDREAAKREMGAWIADYLDDAGYINWATSAPLFKAILLTAFPATRVLEGDKLDPATIPIDEWEDHYTKILAVVDSHLSVNQRQLRPAFGMDTALKMLLRR
jgi:hypothetical protein